MATDATLVNAAYREAMANVPKFDPNIAKSQSELVGNIMDPIAEAIETKAKAKEAEELELEEKNEEYDNLKDDQIAKFTNTADAVNIRLSSFENGGREAGMHEQIYNNTYDYLDELKKEYELYNTVGDDDTPENKKKRVEILGKLEGVKNSTVQFRADANAIGKLAGSKDGGSQMSKHGMTVAEIAITNEILNMDGDYSNVKHRWDKKTNSMFFDVTIPDDVFFAKDQNGNRLFSLKEQKLGQTRTWSAKDIKENFYAIPKEMEKKLLDQTGDYEKAGDKAKWDDKFNLQASADETTDILGNDKKAASHIFQTRQHGQPKTGYGSTSKKSKWEKGSWANALEAHTDLNGKAYKLDPNASLEIVTDLIKSGEVEMSEIDTDTSGDISSEELEAFMSTGNRDEVIDVLVNHKNPLYDHKLSVEEFSAWRAKQNETKFNENKPDKPEAKTNKSTSTSTGFLATANTKKPRGVASGVLGQSFNYNVSKNMYDQFKLSSEGKPAEFSIGKNNYTYDVENNNWIQTTGDGTKKDLGDLNATLGPKGFAIVDPDFMALRTTAAEITEDSDIDFDITKTKTTKSQDAGTASTWNPKIDMAFVDRDDSKVAAALQKMMPTAFDVDSNPLGYKFMNLKSVGAFSGEISSMGDFTKDAVGLYSDDGKTHITYPKGHEKDVDKNGNPGGGKIPVIISLGSDEATRKKAIATIDAIMNTSEFQIGKAKLK